MNWLFRWKYRRLLWETYLAWNRDKPFRMAASLAYYSVFSLAPLLLLVIGISGLVFGEAAARVENLGRLEDLLGKAPAEAVAHVLSDSLEGGSTTFYTLVGLGALLFGASTVFVDLQDSLNTIWKAPPPPGLGLLAWLRSRLLSFAVVLGTGVFLLTELATSVAVISFARSLDTGVWLPDALNFTLAVVLFTLLFALVYKVLPDAAVSWGDVWVGAAITALLYALGRYAISSYLAYSFLASAFGAAGSVLLILSWVYYSALIFLFGAQFTHAFAQRKGMQRPPPDGEGATSR